MILIDTTFLAFGRTGIGTVINQILNLFDKEKVEYKQISYFDYYSKKNIISWYLYFNIILFNEINKLSKNDIFIFPENLGGIVRTAKFKCRTIFIVYDLFELKARNSFLYKIKKLRFLHVLKGVSKIITISNFCKVEISKTFPKLKSKIFVLYPFYMNNYQEKETDNSIKPLFSHEIYQILCSRKYVLANGSGQDRKNAEFLIRNAKKIYNDFGLKLVLFGKDFHNNGYKNIIEAINSFQTKDYIIHIGALTEPQLDYAYEHAACFLFPSLDEGFGLPPVEALLHNCRIAVSEISIFKEILYPLTRFFSFSYDSLSENLKEVLQLSEENFSNERSSILEKFKYETYLETLFSILYK